MCAFLDNQYVSFDGKETKFVEGIFTIFGHGIVCGLGEALDSNRGGLTVFQGKMNRAWRTPLPPLQSRITAAKSLPVPLLSVRALPI